MSMGLFVVRDVEYLAIHAMRSMSKIQKDNSMKTGTKLK